MRRHLVVWGTATRSRWPGDAGLSSGCNTGGGGNMSEPHRITNSRQPPSNLPAEHFTTARRWPEMTGAAQTHRGRDKTHSGRDKTHSDSEGSWMTIEGTTRGTTLERQIGRHGAMYAGLLALLCVGAMAGCRSADKPAVRSASRAVADVKPAAALPEATAAAVRGDADRASAGDEGILGSASGKRPGGPAVAPSPALPGSNHAANDAGDDDEDENDKDYWKGVQFDIHNFDEVLDYVSINYIDALPDRKRAWIEAANFALMSLEPSTELVPAPFFKARAGTPDEEGRLDGTTEPFVCKGQALPEVLLHRLPADDYLKAHRKPHKKGRLSNEEVMALRDKQKSRNLAYNEAWKSAQFGRPQFECAMAYAAQQVQAWQLAQKNAPKPSAKDKPATKDKTLTEKTAEAQPVVAEAKAKAAAAHAVDLKAAGKTDDAKPVADKGKTAKGAKSADEDSKRPPPDINRAWVAAASGFLYAMDPHSSVIPRRAWDESTEKTQDNSFEGIGAVLSQRDDLTIVENPMEGRPAWRAGVRAGDVIHRVDGVDVSGLMLSKVVKLIRGKRNTKVVLTISRESDPEPHDIGITREQIEIKNVDGELVKEYPGIAHVKMAGFIPKSTDDLRSKIDELAKQAPGGKLTGLVLDLRGNSGGLLNQAIDVADLFLPAGKRIVAVKSRRRPEEVHEARSTFNDYNFPVVVLVNDGSASASEIVASALQDNARALVVGLRTFGKASVQTLFEPALHLDYYIKLTVARYYAPNGQTIQVVGVTPDVTVSPDADGKIPVGFREENLNNHLIPIEGTYKSPWLPQMPVLNKCIAETGQGDKIAKREPKPQIHPDFQLLRAADYVVCLARHTQAVAR